MKLKTNCLFTKLLIVMLSLFLMFSAVSPKVYADAGKSLENESDTITVCVSMEKFTLGQGYIIEPTLVKVKEGTLASVVITDLLKARYPDIPQPWRMTGSIDNSFYLSAVYDPNRGTPSIPQYILDHAKVDVDRCTEDWLGEFDYYSMSGWMYCVNGKFPNVGAAAWPMKDGEVMRWQFTLYGYGADLGADNKEWGTPDITNVGNKDKLIWEMAKYNAAYDKASLMQNESYVNALAVLQDLETPQEQIDAALAALGEDGPGHPNFAENNWYKDEVEVAFKDTADYIHKTVSEPQVGSVGGEWAVLGLARSGYQVPEQYYQDYYSCVESYVKAKEGNLHDKKYTEYSRLIVALTSIGKDPGNVAGYDLLKPLGDYDKTIWQGLNGSIWALIALDSGNYPMPQNSKAKTQATREMYVNRILECQLPDGGFSLFGGTAAASSGDNVSDPDITGMALQALAKYKDRKDVVKVIDEALACMSKKQNEKGGYSSWETANSESVVQIIVALTELGIPLNDPRFVKNGNTLLDNLMGFYQPGKGFSHTQGGDGSNMMATEQAFYGLVAARRAKKGENSLYRMGDAIKVANSEEDAIKAGEGLKNKHPDVKAQPIIYFEKTFEDISGANAHANYVAIEALAARGIISGKTDTTFDPDATMTRAEFAAIVVRGLGLVPKTGDKFADTPKDAWYSGYVGTANAYGIVKGVTDTTFNPTGVITREEAAVMVARAAALCGMDTEVDPGELRDILAQFGDYIKTSEWSRAALTFCYKEGVLDETDLNIRAKAPIKRSEIAQMIFNMLGSANLL
ncbi:MAG: S-layer homology domain-containing protein [Eubacteriales bacterium]|nr:S-layer homology domain-containing protein [Eubacteriales bacterium]